MSNLPQLIDGFAYDIRYTTRMLRKNPGFASTAIVTLVLAIGASTAVFTVVRAVLLRPLHYPNPERVVRVSGGAAKTHFDEFRAGRRVRMAGIGDHLMQTEDVTLAEAATPEVIKHAFQGIFLRCWASIRCWDEASVPKRTLPPGRRLS